MLEPSHRAGKDRSAGEKQRWPEPSIDAPDMENGRRRERPRGLDEWRSSANAFVVLSNSFHGYRREADTTTLREEVDDADDDFFWSGREGDESS